MSINSLSVKSLTRTPEEFGGFMYVVEFLVDMSPKEATFEVPVTVAGDFDEDHVIRGAKAMLHSHFAALAEMTKQWAVHDDVIESWRKK